MMRPCAERGGFGVLCARLRLWLAVLLCLLIAAPGAAALEEATARLAAARAAGDPAGEVDALLARAGIWQRLGRHLDALEDLNAARPLAERLGDPARQATLGASLGASYLAQRQPAAARAALEDSLAQARAAGLVAHQAATLNTLGNLLAAEEETEAALAALADSARLARAAGEPSMAGAALINGARLLARQDDAAAARARLDEARDLLAAAPGSPDKAFRLLALGRALASLGAADEAEAAYMESHALAQAAGDGRLLSYAQGYRGQLLEQAGEVEAALAPTRRALFLAQSVGAPEVLYLWQWQLGRLLAAAGEPDAAISAYDDAIATIAGIRADLLTFDPRSGRSTLRETVEPVYLEQADLLLRRAGATPEADAREADLDAARRLIERFRAAELEDYFQDECVAELQARVRPIDRLDAGTAAIYPIVLAGRTVLLLSLPDGLVQVPIPVEREVLEAEVHELRRLLEKRTTREYLPLAQRLHQRLIQPIEPALAGAGIDTLVVIPDGALRTIPLAALHDGERFLVERFAIATAPGLELLDPEPFARTRPQVLLNGLTESVQGFPALPYVAEELATIQEMLGGERLQDESFVVPGLEESLARTPYSVVHIASHGEFAGDPKDSFLLTWDGRLDMDGLERFIKLSRFRDEPVELLTLSACRTAAGDDRAALGLAGVAIKAGARSALATLWFINDQASSLLVAEFYRELGGLPTPTKARALQRAQQAIMADRRYRHPAYWSPFLIIGNWL
jgi:CHAT domain-containing protein